MKYFSIECEAPGGGFGPTAKLVYHQSGRHIERVDYLDLIFDVWLGGEIIQNVGCFCVTEKLWNFLRAEGIAGVSARDMTVTPGENVNNLCKGQVIPRFKELLLERGLKGVRKECWQIERSSIPNADMFTGIGLPMFVSENGRELLLRYEVTELEIEEAVVTYTPLRC